MSRPRWLPSRLVAAVLARLLGRRDDALGDLDEELQRRRRAGRGVLRDEVWYAREGASLVFAVLRERLAPHDRRGEGRIIHDGRPSMGAVTRDVGSAMRALVRRPGPSAALIGTIALTVGASAAVFGLISATWLRPLPYPAADRLVRVYSSYGDGGHTALAPATWRALAEDDDVVEAVGVWGIAETVHLAGDGDPVRLVAPRASAGLFELAGLTPALGRLLRPGDEVPGADDVVVLAHGFWVRHFGGEPGVLGRRLVLDGRAYEVVGVADARMALPPDADLWRPLALGGEWFTPARSGWEFLGAVARLRPGHDAPDAARLLTGRYAEREPDRAERLGQGVAVVPFRDDLLGPTGSVLLYLMLAVGLLLALAVVNVAAVLLARSEERLREFATRRALGAGGAPIARAVLTEALVLTVAGGALGLLLAHGALARAAGLELEGLAVLGPPRVDARVVGFVLAVVAAVTLALASAPAVRALRADPAAVLRAGGRGAAGSRAGSRLRRGLVVGQIALALVLLAGLGIAGRGFTALVGADPGFDPGGVLALTFELPETPGEAEPAAEFYRGLEERLRALPGVSAAGFTNGLPLEGTVWSASFELVAPEPEVGDAEPGANMRAVSPGYFDAMGMRVLAGRGFDEDERAGRSAPVVVVDETLARRFWPQGSPLGRRVIAGALSREEATIVGVVADVPDQGLHAPSSGHLYLPMLQRPQRRATAVLRSDGDPEALAAAARAAVREADPRVPVFDVRTLEDRLAAELAGPRLAVLLLAGFGVLALILATLGVYGVLAHATSLRRGEIGTRIALGARPAAVARGVLLEGLGLWALGALLGGAGAAWAAGPLVRVLPTAPPVDALTLAAAGVALGLASLLAAWVPAWRAARLDPAEALRRE